VYTERGLEGVSEDLGSEHAAKIRAMQRLANNLSENLILFLCIEMFFRMVNAMNGPGILSMRYALTDVLPHFFRNQTMQSSAAG
jgi:hypothetical protein